MVQTGFAPLGAAIGNLTIGKGTLHGQSVFVALMENRLASGSFGVDECEKLASLMRVATSQQTPMLLYLDSAGARVTQGLPALGAFRRLFRSACELVCAGTPLIAVPGANCYGGASMLAALASARHFCDNTQFAMSGPSILAQAAGGSALDEMFRAIAQATIGAESRIKRGLDNAAFGSDFAIPAAFNVSQRHRELRVESKARIAAAERIQRKDLALLYPAGYEILESEGVLHGEAQYEDAKVAVLGLVNRKPLGALQAWALADRIWQMKAAPPAHLHVLVDCDAHSATLDDERLMLSSHIVDIALALAELSAAGTVIDCIVLGTLGGGAYVALAAVASQVSVVYGAQIQLLPGKAIASILGENVDGRHEIDDYVAAGVAERELKIGMVPTSATTGKS
ncbi:MAG: hypothetical protein HY255_05910 [Betaproteobacteria bacterium]|nr:hypothetical protein [Betaproteobacteria bacterium]